VDQCLHDRGPVSTCVLPVLAFSCLLSDYYQVMGGYLDKFDKCPACSDLSESLLSGVELLVNLYP
jgi:hypothetical protein